MEHPTANSPSFLVAFREGFGMPWEGFKYMGRHPRLWRHGAIAVALNLLITGVVLFLLVLTAVGVISRVHPLFPPGWTWRLLEVLSGIAIVAMALGLSIAAWMLLQGVLCGYFYSKLARQVEIQLGARPEELQEVKFTFHLADALHDVASLIGVNLAFLCLHIVPVIGSIAAVGGSVYYDCYLLGSDYLDFPLELRGRNRTAKRQFARQHRPQVLGLGAIVLLISFVPIIGSVLLTTAATGAVLLHRRLEAVPSPGPPPVPQV
jgi:CysZ protein